MFQIQCWFIKHLNLVADPKSHSEGFWGQIPFKSFGLNSVIYSLKFHDVFYHLVPITSTKPIKATTEKRQNRVCIGISFFCVRVDASTIFFNYCSSICFSSFQTPKKIYNTSLAPWRNLWLLVRRHMEKNPFRKIYLDTCCNF